MYLSNLTINTVHTQARKDLGNPHDLHRTIMNAFPTPLPAGERVLFRVEGGTGGASQQSLVQSQNTPDWEAVSRKFPGYLAGAAAVKDLGALKISNGTVYRFRLRAAPGKRVIYKESGKSQRISLFSEKDRREWLARKGAAGGFALDEARLLVRDAPYRTVFISGEDKTYRATLNMVDFDGLLQVEDNALFLRTIAAGIGPAKGLGCGLLTLALA